jgi:hypothetical protein
MVSTEQHLVWPMLCLMVGWITASTFKRVESWQWFAVRWIVACLLTYSVTCMCWYLFSPTKHEVGSYGNVLLWFVHDPSGKYYHYPQDIAARVATWLITPWVIGLRIVLTSVQSQNYRISISQMFFVVTWTSCFLTYFVWSYKERWLG